MDLNAIDVFCRVAALGGVGAAAREMRVTQSAVSQRLRSLERSLGRKLYGRAENRLVLTEHGRQLLAACQPELDRLRAAESLLKGSEAHLRGRIRIVALSEFSKVFLLERIKRFSAAHPAVAFSMEYRSPAEMPALLLGDEADLMFTNEPPAKKQLEIVPGFTEEYVLAGPKPARSFSWTDLAGLPWLSCRSQDNSWFEFVETLARNGVRLPRPTVEIADIESLLTLAAQGLGYTLVPRHAMELRTFPGLAAHRIPRWKNEETIYFCRLKTVPMGPALQAFWDFLRPRKKRSDQRR